jgi:hypothetical protein
VSVPKKSRVFSLTSEWVKRSLIHDDWIGVEDEGLRIENGLDILVLYEDQVEKRLENRMSCEGPYSPGRPI